MIRELHELLAEERAATATADLVRLEDVQSRKAALISRLASSPPLPADALATLTSAAQSNLHVIKELVDTMRGVAGLAGANPVYTPQGSVDSVGTDAATRSLGRR